MKRGNIWGAAAVAVAIAAPAWAQTEEETQTWDDDVLIIEEDRQVMVEEEQNQSFAQRDRSMISVMAGGGVEGYLGEFRGEVEPGPGWSVVASGQPTRALGFEVGYSGAANNLDDNIAGGEGAANGADIIRNGGHAAVTLAAPTPGVQPYALAGVGIDRYTFRGTDGQFGYGDDTSGSVPLGVGLRTGLGPLSADLRFNYDVLFEDEFSPVDANAGDGRYSGLLHIGGRF